MKCDSCITGEACHHRLARVSLPEGRTIEATIVLCEICFAVSNQLQDAIMRIARNGNRIREGSPAETLKPASS